MKCDSRLSRGSSRQRKIVYISLRLPKRICDIFDLKLASEDEDFEVPAQISMILHEKIMLALVAAPLGLNVPTE